MKIYNKALLLFLFLILTCGMCGCQAQPSIVDSLPFKLDIQCNDYYCDIKPSGPDLIIKSNEVMPQKILQYQNIIGTKQGTMFSCLFGDGQEDTFYVISIKDNHKTISNKTLFNNVYPWVFAVNPKEDAFYMSLHSFGYRSKQQSEINNTPISKSLLKDNTFLVLSAKDFKVLDTVTTSLCNNPLVALNGSILSTVAINGKISKCKWDTPHGEARLDTTAPNVFYIDDKPALLSNGNLIAYDISEKKLYSVPINSNGLYSNHVGGIPGYNIVSNSDTGMYISLTYRDEVKIKDNRKLEILRKELVYYNKKSKKIKNLYVLKCRPVKYVIEKNNSSYSGMVFGDEILQENDKYIVYSVLGIDTGIHESTGYEHRMVRKDSFGNMTDTVYQSMNYNIYFTVNIVISKETGKVVDTKTYKGFTILRNNENPYKSKERKVWAIDKDLGPDFINRIFYENNRLITVIDEPYQEGYPEKYIYRVYKN